MYFPIDTTIYLPPTATIEIPSRSLKACAAGLVFNALPEISCTQNLYPILF